MHATQCQLVPLTTLTAPTICALAAVSFVPSLQDRSLVAVAFTVALQMERPSLEHLTAERCPPKLKRLIVQCWDHDPMRRPGAAEVVKELLLVQEKVGDRYKTDWKQ